MISSSRWQSTPPPLCGLSRDSQSSTGPALERSPISWPLLVIVPLRPWFFPLGPEIDFFFFSFFFFLLLALRIINEVASLGSAHSDPAVAKHLACLIRENPEVTMPEFRHITAGALVERDVHGVPNVITSFGLDTEAKREHFLSE